ncbi:ammonium transporter [Raphidocelis subcapitata]|uniref:Ammonium transporter n=1 Tax=Raphidocelis subcapitata TaxID=307507 RepID=A0A2V0NZ35_9CHLO|nr:ammonium transporter [Raphidocelis subcapitata]|eukprot:GBF92579.1 ammonium transporter [Raphidocelis subcapitata]
MALTCSPADLKAVTGLVGDPGLAGAVCSSVDVAGAASPLAAVLQHLAAAAAAAAAAPSDSDREQSAATDASFMLLSGYLVFMMQAGFAVLCAGHIRPKNNGNILLKNLLDCAIGTLAWYLVGYGFAYGEPRGGGGGNGFIGSGTANFALSSQTKTVGIGSYYHFFFTWAFSAASATIVAGAVAERVSLLCYTFYSCLMSGLTYPVVVHWLWTRDGWLSATAARPLFGSGAIDFAGGVAVHTVGGVAALLGTYFCGPRLGRFEMDGEPAKGFRDNNSNMVVLGTFLLWFGWYGFNPGSTGAISSYRFAVIASRAAVTTTVAAGVGGLAAMVIARIILSTAPCRPPPAPAGSCGVIDVWAAGIVGILGAAVFIVGDTLMLRARLDDVVAAVPMHLGCGVVGTLFVGFFARKQYVIDVYGMQPYLSRRWGVFFGGDGRLLACQLIAVLVTICWVCLIMLPYFFLMAKLQLIRVPFEQEIAGLDASKHGVLTTNELPRSQGSMVSRKESTYK